MVCPFCKVPTNYVFTINRFFPPFDIYKCSFCNLYIKKQRENEAYYNKEYYQGNAPYSYIDERKFEVYFREVWEARIKNIKKYKPPPAKVLDVGCSFGGFVKVFLENGYDAEGIDISKYATKEAQRNPLLKNRIFYSDILNFSIKKKYDIITLIEVIEHLNNPEKVFEKIAKLLNPNGLLILQTANFDGLQAILQGKRYHYFLPGHLYYYSKSNLIPILKRYDFEKFINYHGVDFGLIPKLKKAKGMLKNRTQFIKIIGYHLLSKIYLKNFSLTSSYVLYAFKI
ncbi:MAG: class I SAM-dependent methyltransferase [Leptonema sp. (in: bacteria)]